MPTAISLHSVLRPKASVTARRLLEEMVLLDLETGCYFGLNPVGTEVWERVQGGAALGDIIAGIVEAYEVARADCERDVLKLAGELVERGLVSVAEPARNP